MGRTACPSADDLGRLLGDRLPAADRDRVADHLDGCPGCQRRLDALLADGAVTPRAGRTDEAGPDPEYLDRLRELVAQTVSSGGSWSGPSPRRRAEAATECPSAIGEYEILGEIARGGMAVVYKARQPHLGRIVAVKRLRFHDHAAAEVERFRREAEAVARLRHPNIVQVFQVGQDDGRPFLALEYVHGPTLADYLSGTPVDPRSAAAFLRTVASAVHHAHEQGIIHRDLKPANILLAPTGPRSGAGRQPLGSFAPRVTDFGLARRVDDTQALTQPDMLAGTPAYLAPEQLTRDPAAVTPACDLYALGAVLYEALTGRPPLLGPTVLATLRLVAEADPPPPRTLQPHLPRDLEAVCLKCLQKDPRRRYGSVAELAADLDRFLADRPTLARPVGGPARAAKLVRRHPLAAATAVLFAAAVVAGLAGVLWQWREAVAARGRLQVALTAEAEWRRDAEENLYLGRLAQAVALWEDGDVSQARRLLAACRPADREADHRGWEWHYLSRQFRPELTVVPVPYWAYGLALIPDPMSAAPELAVAVGRPLLNANDRVRPGDGFAGVLRGGTLRPGPSLFGAATAVATHPAGQLVVWGTNAGELVVSRGDATSAERVVRTPAPVTATGISLDGKTVFAAGEDARLRTYDLAAGGLIAERPVPAGGRLCLAIRPTGRLVACGGRTGGVRLYDPSDLREVGELAAPPGRCRLVVLLGRRHDPRGRRWGRHGRAVGHRRPPSNRTHSE